MLCLSRKGNKLCYIAADIFQSIVSLLSTISHNRENIYLTVGEFLLYIGNKLLVLIWKLACKKALSLDILIAEAKEYLWRFKSLRLLHNKITGIGKLCALFAAVIHPCVNIKILHQLVDREIMSKCGACKKHLIFNGTFIKYGVIVFHKKTSFQGSVLY